MTGKGKKIGFIALVGAFVTTGALAVATAKGGHHGKDHEARKAEMLKKHDKNGDGTLDAAEKKAAHEDMKKQHEEHRKAELAKYDANKDGVLDETERAAQREDLIAEHFKALDTNNDGKLSIEEFSAGAPDHGPHMFGGRGGHFRHGGPGKGSK